MRGRLLFLTFFTVFLLITARYFQLQVLEWRSRRAYIDSLKTRMIELKPPRGRILSSDGKVLAWSEERYYAKASGPFDEEGVRGVLDPERFKKLVLGEEVEVSRIEADSIERYGVVVEKRYVRLYSGLAPHVVGYVDSDGRGVSGVEYVMNGVLTGNEGTALLVIDPRGRVRGRIVETPPMPGRDVVLTIDSRMQKKAEEILRELGKPSVIILMKTTGEIITMASHPSFDPNEIVGRMSRRDWERLSRDPRSPFLNRAISALYPPGSAIKPFVALAYLLKYGLEDEEIYCDGKFEYVGRSGKVLATYWDWLKSGHGITDLRKAIRVSCNVYFYRIGLKIGVDEMRKLASALRLDSKTGVDLPGEVSGLFPSRSWKEERFGEPWYPGDTILLSIGQGYVLLTPIELLEFYSFIANDGVEYVPKVVEGSREERLRLDVPREYINFLKEALLEVTTHPGGPEDAGTAYHAFRDFPVRVAGKTGTAEVEGGTHSWFVGFAPYEDPEVVVVVLVEKGGSGGKTAAPIAKRLLREYFRLFH